MALANAAGDKDHTVLRLSIDSKPRVKIGNLSRNGKDRRQFAPQAKDHHTQWDTTILPFGIFNLQTDDLTIYMCESPDTSDFILHCLEQWWQFNHLDFPQVETLAINLDGGSSTPHNPTQFIKGMVEFSRKYLLQIQLIYYPPYHSKYNPIEPCWAALE